MEISENNPQTNTIELSQLLADEYLLYNNTRNSHWNVEGTDFYEKHKFFENQFEEIDGVIDNVADRIRSLTRYAYATLKSFLALTHFREVKTNEDDCQTYLKELLSDHETIIIHCRENVHCFGTKDKDPGTNNFITELMENHEKMAWFIRSHLQ